MPSRISGDYTLSFYFREWRTDEDSWNWTIREEKRESGPFKEPKSLEGAHVYRDTEEAEKQDEVQEEGTNKEPRTARLRCKEATVDMSLPATFLKECGSLKYAIDSWVKAGGKGTNWDRVK
ncbi:hypothetical protein NDU88_008229 [Pleurodeles waltl]|uniref:Uncharacterized protein n=1 Tax=Pleurodeles waltl TaxID=8319 RepID=A0AAV7N941_PLEWA|nr:hypothetical protein NDU88_008229 [Pleurodeles waltl]